MKQNNLEANLQSLDKTDLYIILWYVRLRWLRHKISLLRPVQMLIPVSLLQIISFIVAMHFPKNFIPIAVAGNLIAVGVALFPMTFSRPLKAHWVSLPPNDAFSFSRSRERAD